MKDNLRLITNEINNAKKIAIFTHKYPDLDALGSSLSLYYACLQLNKETDIYTNEELSNKKLKLIGENPFKKAFIDKDYDLMISTDTSSAELLGDYKDFFINAKKNIVIDHHSSDFLKGTFTYRKSNYSSCCEVVYEIIKELKINLNSKIASLLYMGLIGDTNSFINTNTNANSFYIAYKCTKAGADITKINELEFKSKRILDIEIEKYLLNNYKVENGVAYCLMTLQTLEKYHAIKDDCDFYSSKLLTMENVKISFSIVEQSSNYYSISMRGKSGYNVKDIASKFGGGGHIPAAGAKLFAEDIESLKDKVLSECIKQSEIK